MKIMNPLKRIGLWFAATVASVSLLAAPSFNQPVSITQPDGSKVECLGSGDEYGYRLFDRGNYTLVKETGGYVAYAIPAADGTLKPSGLRYGKVNPAAAGLTPGIGLSPAAMARQLDNYRKKNGPVPGDKNFPAMSMKSLYANAAKTGSSSQAASATQYSTISRSAGFTNLVILIRFKDTKFSMNLSTFDKWFNSTTSASLKDYYLKHSHGSLTIDSFICAKSGSDVNVVCYEDENPIGYYCNKTDANPIGGKADAGAMKGRAYQWVLDNKLIPESKNLDADSNGRVDSICIIYATQVSAEGRTAIKDLLPAGFDPASYNPSIGWAEALWPHSGGMGGYTFNGKSTSSYIQQWGDGDSLSLGVFCHEMGHLLGAPDFYRYYTGGEPVGGWSHMAGSPWGMPIGMDMLTRYKYHQFQPDGNGDGVLDLNDVPVITRSGIYTLYPSYLKPDASMDALTGKHVAYHINSKVENQYFLLEYRKVDANSYDQQLGKQQGMTIARIRTDLGGNAGGPPDEFYIYRPSENKYVTGPAGDLGKAAFAEDWARTEFNYKTDPKCFLEDDSDGGVSIAKVSKAGDTITFEVKIPGSEYVSVTPPTLTVEGAADSTGDYTVMASKTSWSVKSSQSWARVTKNADATGFTATATSANNTGSARTAELSVSLNNADTVVVKFIQNAAGNLVVNPGTQTIVSTGGNAIFKVEKLPEGVTDWTATPDATWLTVVQDKTANPPTFTATATANTVMTARFASIKVKAGTDFVTVKVYQDADPGILVLEVTPATITIPATAGSTAVFSLTKIPTTATTWTAVADATATWLTITADKTAKPPTFTGTATANTGAQRTAEITVKAGTETKKVTVIQEAGVDGGGLEVTPATRTIAATAGSTAVFEVTALPKDVTAWTAVADATATWLTITKDEKANPPTFTGTATANAGVTRTAEITVTAGPAFKKVMVIQEGMGGDSTLVVTPMTWTYAAAGADKVFSVAQLPTGVTDWSATTAETWLTITTDKQAKPPTLTVKAAANIGAVRSGKVTVTAGEKTVNLSLYQLGNTGSGSVQIKIDKVAPQATSADIACTLSYTDVAIVECGICWSTTTSQPAVTDNKVTATVGPAYTITLGSLVGGTKYYVRAYAKSDIGVLYYSNVKTFTPVVIPAPRVGSFVKKGGYYMVTFEGTVSFKPDYLVTGRGFVYGTSPNPTKQDCLAEFKMGQGRGYFSAPVRKTDASGTYYMRAYADTNVTQDTTYGNSVQFTFEVPPATK